MVVRGSIVKQPAGGMKGYADSYMKAMHGLCIECHEQKRKEAPHAYSAGFARCSACHRGVSAAGLRSAPPYVSRAMKGGAR